MASETLYLARDGDGTLFLLRSQPTWEPEWDEWSTADDEGTQLPCTLYPEVLPGTCRRVTLTLEPEEAIHA